MEKLKKKRRLCSVFGCDNDSRMPNIALFHLPKEVERRTQWLKLINRDDLLQREDLKHKSYLVCSKHFEESDMRTSKMLLGDAVPSKRLNETDGTCLGNYPSTSKVTEPSKVEATATGIITEYSRKPGTNDKPKTQAGLNKLPTKDQTRKPRKRKSENESNLNPKRQLNRRIEEIKMEQTTNTSKDPGDEVGRKLSELIAWQNKNGSRRREALFALKMHCYSPQAYRCLQTVLKLPSEGNLKKIKINIPQKLDERVLENLKLKTTSLPGTAKYCILCVDEMAIKKSLYYDTKADKVTGILDINNDTREVASKAFVIMLQGIYHKWRQLIAYVLFDNANHCEELDSSLNDVINKLSEIEIRVKAIAFNQDSSYGKYVEEVKGVTIEKPYFLHDNTKIYYIINVPHLMKCVRDDLFKNDLYHNGDKISWDYIDELYKDQKEKDLRLIPKLTESHIQPDNLSNKDVKTAVEVFSRTVAVALNTYIDLNVISEEARPTADFIEIMNNLYDILNSSKTKSDSFQSIKTIKEQEMVLNDAEELFANTEAVDKRTGEVTLHLKSFQSFRASIHAVRMLYADLRDEGLTYLPTRRLNGDWNGLFTSIRQQSSGADPTPIQLQRAFSKLCLSNMIESSASNRDVDILDVLIKAEDMMNPGTTGSVPQSRVYLNGESDYRMELPDKDTLAYVSAYLLYKCVDKHMCRIIEKLLKSAAMLNELNSHNKPYNKELGFCGSLKTPPNKFTMYVGKLDEVFTENFDNVILQNPGSQLFEYMKAVPPQTPCTCFPVDYLLKLFVRLRIYTTLRFNNRSFKKDRSFLKVTPLN